MHRIASLVLVLLAALVAWLAPGGTADAKKVSDIRGTKHNLSASNVTGTAKSAESQVCVFCHTPHAADSQPGAPLWNRQLRNDTYKIYESTSIDASIGQPDGLSKLCLSCHDGALALGSVNVINGKPGANLTGKSTDIIATTPGGNRMPVGDYGETSGFTRNLGMDLSNDHPISFTFDKTLADADGELNTPPTTSTVAGKTGQVIVGIRDNAFRAGEDPEARRLRRPLLPLEEGKVQCTTCHDPHLKEDTPGAPSIKFLRLNRLQGAVAPDGSFNEDDDQFCMACHNKDMGGANWAQSAHANKDVADEQYNATDGAIREFPANLPVWQAGCLNCHDTHTVQGARRLLREGTSDGGRPKRGGESAIEETCYQCHTTSGESVLKANTTVPNIKTDFTTLNNTHMPISNADRNGKPEVHNIGTGSGTKRGKDFVEDPTLLGSVDHGNRHVECTDCHNPHRVMKSRVFNSTNRNDVAGTHLHNTTSHSNIASGVLRGITGLQILTWQGNEFLKKPATWRELRGVGDTDSVDDAWVTREYQVCMKCHSKYAYGDTPPVIGNTKGGTTGTAAQGMATYTDQGMEFQAPDTHQGEVTNRSLSDSGAHSRYALRNHRSWHPVMKNTLRTTGVRGLGTGAFRAPWNGASAAPATGIGYQTMYCSDCHGSSTRADSVDPNCTTAATNCGEDGAPWGPHGSANPFILKGVWGSGAGLNTTNMLCLKCHNPTSSSGFNNSSRGNLHAYHRDKIRVPIQCTWCHVAVPHGWKNRSLLVNLNDVGPEAGAQYVAGTEVNTKPFTAPPYYLNAVVKIFTFGTPGNWADTDCGPTSGTRGKDWMKATCESGP